MPAHGHSRAIQQRQAGSRAMETPRPNGRGEAGLKSVNARRADPDPDIGLTLNNHRWRQRRGAPAHGGVLLRLGVWS